MNKVRRKGLYAILLIGFAAAGLNAAKTHRTNVKQNAKQDVVVMLEMAQDKPRLCQSDLWQSEIAAMIDDGYSLDEAAEKNAVVMLDFAHKKPVVCGSDLWQDNMMNTIGESK